MLAATLKRATNLGLDILLPPLCLGCDGPVGGGHSLCAACWGGISFITKPFCNCCGAPFETPVGEGLLCGACIANPPAYRSARSPMLYNEASKRLVLSFKHSDRIHTAGALAGWIQRAAAEIWDEVDYIVPVPLHRWRLFKRRYNQAALLALQLGRKTGKPVLVDALLRVKPTPSQGHLGRKERQANIKGAFQVNPRCTAKLADKTIMLVDDVLTTGATVNECANVLEQGGVAASHVVTVARVPGFS